MTRFDSDKHLMHDVDASVFDAVQKLEFDSLSDRKRMLVLPYLARLILNPAFEERKQLLGYLYRLTKMGEVIQLMSVKTLDHAKPPLNASSFESSDCVEKLIIVRNESFVLFERILRVNGSGQKMLQSKFFDNPIYIDDISYCLSALLAHQALNIRQLMTSLLHIKHGCTYIQRIIANMPEDCRNVCQILVDCNSGVEESSNFDISQQRSRTLKALCMMNPSLAFTVRGLRASCLGIEKMIAEHAIKVPVTKCLNNDMKEFVPIHCVKQLLDSGSFGQHDIPIKGWIYAQICESTKPIHHEIPQLIESFIKSTIPSKEAKGVNERIEEKDVIRIFKTTLYSNEDQGEAESDNSKNQVVDLEAAQVIFLHYLLICESLRRKRSTINEMEYPENFIEYNPEILRELPIFFLVQLVRCNQRSFGVMYPYLMKEVTSQFPELCSIQHWLSIADYEPPDLDKDDQGMSMVESSTNVTSCRAEVASRKPKEDNSSFRDKLREQMKAGFATALNNPNSLTDTLKVILDLPRVEVWPFVGNFMEKFSSIIEFNQGPEYKKLIKHMAQLWWTLNTLFPRKLWVMTVNALRRPHTPKNGPDIQPVELSWDELVLDPLNVLRCDNRVFRCVETLDIVLHVLEAFLAASKPFLNGILEQKNGNKLSREFGELRDCFSQSQISAAVQILLESCLPSEEEQEVIVKRDSKQELTADEELTLEKYNSSVDCICEHLHQVFIADTNIAKLVHFQTYPNQLLEITSNRIPSMHICIDFIPELLSQPELSKQIFVIELASHLCEKYAITKSLNVAKLCFNVAYTLLQLLPSERRALFFIPVLPALVKICKVFPILREDADIILSQINQITVAHLASTSSRLSLGSARPFEGVEKMSWRDANKLMSTLSLNEALYMCIKKCSFDLSYRT